MIICEGVCDPYTIEFAKNVQLKYVEEGLNVLIRTSFGHPAAVIDFQTMPIVLNV